MKRRFRRFGTRQHPAGIGIFPRICHAARCKERKARPRVGFTTARDLSSGETLDVDLRNAINDTRKAGAVADHARE